LVHKAPRSFGVAPCPAAKAADTRYLCTTKVCRRYGRHRTWLWRHLRDGFPQPALRIAGQPYWLVADLDDFDRRAAVKGEGKP
jgi:hypothetical protein